MAATVTYPRTARALADALHAASLAPNRRLGQCFLTDAQAVDAIVRDAGVTAADRVVEVGTGPGLLTFALAETGAEVVTFDVDARLQRFARSLTDWPERVTFVEGDVLCGKHDFAPTFAAALDAPAGAGGQRLLVSNLPYHVATPILLGALARAEPLERIVVMVQREVAEKLLAPVGDPERGASTVLVDVAATGRILRRFPPDVFRPRPRVESALLRLDPRRPSPYRPGEAGPFGRFVTALFTRRRKVLRQAVAHALDVPVADAAVHLEAVGLDPAGRPQEASAHALLALLRRAGSGGSHGAPGE